VSYQNSKTNREYC